MGPAGGDLGTVQTLAGAGFCPDAGSIDPLSVSVAGVAVDPVGTIHVATGPGGDGRIVKVDDIGRTELLSAPTEVGASTSPTAAATATGGRMLASDAAGGALVGLASRIVQLTDRREITIAGVKASADGAGQSTGDGGPAAAARFRRLLSITTDVTGSAYVADEVDPGGSTFRIRFINRTAAVRTFYGGSPSEVQVGPGQIDTIAGGGGPSAEGSPPRSLGIGGGSPVMAAAGDRLYLASERPSTPDRVPQVELVNLGGTLLSTHGVALDPGARTTLIGPGGPLAANGLGEVPPLAADERGNLYLGDPGRHRVIKIDPAGAAMTFAGTGVAGFDGNGRPAVAAKLDRPVDIAAGPFDRIYLSDQGNGQVRFVGADGLIQAAPGNGAGLRWQCEREPAPGGPPEMPRPGAPSGVAVDERGNVYVAGSALGQVKRIAPDGRVTTAAGRGHGRVPCGPPPDCADIGDRRAAIEARLVRPVALALRSERLYVFDAGDTRVRLVNLGSRSLTAHGLPVEPGAIITVAGNGMLGVNGDGGPALAAELLNVASLAADSLGNLFIADGIRVRRIDPAGIITTSLPTGTPEAGRCCGSARGLAVDGSDNLFIADPTAGRVWVLNRTSTPLTRYGLTVAPGATAAVTAPATTGSSAGEGSPDALVPPSEVAVDDDGDLLTVGGNVLQRIDGAGKVTTVAGSGSLGFNGDGQPARLTTFNNLTDVAVDPCGNLVVADQTNDRVRRVLIAACVPARPPEPAGRSSASPTVVLVAMGAAAVAALCYLAVRHRRRAGTSNRLQR